MPIAFRMQKAQGATEYLVLMSVVLTIALICIAILVWPTGSSKDVKQSQKDINLGIGKIAFPELAQGLVAYYKFDEGIGDTAYNSVAQNLNDATMVNGTGWASGLRGKAASFDGAGDYITVQYQLPTNAITVSAWVKPNSTANNRAIVSAGSGFEFYSQATTGQLCFWTSAQGSSCGGTVTTGTWHHAAMTYDGTTVYVYLNGAQVASGAKTITGTSTTYIGSYNNPSEFWNGIIDDLHIYSRVLSPQEIELLYKNPGYP